MIKIVWIESSIFFYLLSHCFHTHAIDGNRMTKETREQCAFRKITFENMCVTTIMEVGDGHTFHKLPPLFLLSLPRSKREDTLTCYVSLRAPRGRLAGRHRMSKTEIKTSLKGAK